MDRETDACQIAVIAQSEAAWARFVRSGQVFLAEEAILHRAQRELRRRLTVEKGPGVRANGGGGEPHGFVATLPTTTNRKVHE